MFPNIEMIKKYCDISNQEQSLLEHISRPIVLLRKKEELFSTEVCKGSPDMGAMLPCNPLQILLCETCGPLVMTSGNRSGEPIITDNADMIQWMKEAVEIELGILMHERRILAPLDDSIMRIVAGKTQIFRRSRGFVPEPVTINKQFNRTVFATGGDLKSSFAFASGDRIYLSQYLGDIEDASVSKLYDAQRMRMEKLFGFVPEEVVTDLHPAYLSAKKAEMVRQEHEVMHPAYKIQHHHAHIASVIAEHGLSGKTLGIAFDGTGYGTDHTIWGSEFLLCEGTRFERVASLKPVKLIGGDEGAKNTDTILYGYLHSIGLGQEDGILKLQHIDMQKYKIVRAAIEHDINTVTSTSMGRLFDAVSALLNICHYNDYEGEAAIELENMAVKKCVSIPLKINLKRSKGRIVGCTDVLFKGLIDGMTQGVDKASLAAGFIEAVRRFIVDVCKRIDEPFDQIALSGGTFQNKLLLESVYAALTSDGYRVYINEQVPPGDGGISLGQAYLMASK
jgi:hydrogenase maturation protein HypF